MPPATQGPATPDGTIDILASSDANDVHLVFAHTIFVDEARDELYAGTLFTTTGAQTCMTMQGQCGSIAVFAGASTLDGPQVAVRHVFGPATTLNQPHGVWVDRTRDILYATNTFAGTIVACIAARPASTVITGAMVTV